MIFYTESNDISFKVRKSTVFKEGSFEVVEYANVYSRAEGMLTIIGPGPSFFFYCYILAMKHLSQ